MMRWMLFAVALAAVYSHLAIRSHAGLFKLDCATNQNDADGVELSDWDTLATWIFWEFPDNVGTWTLTDFSQDNDNDVTLAILDNVALSAQLGLDFPSGMSGNNPTHERLDVVYDGINVPYTVKDDYLYRVPDTVGTELLFRFANLNPGKYNVTVFEGRTTDSNGQFGKIWVDGIDGANEPTAQNTGDFSGTHLEGGVRMIDPEGNPKTLTVEINAGDYLWYAHLEDYSGGISGIIIRSIAGVADRDRDGMPDDWETHYALNPDDPSDAAKDCNNNGVTNLDEYTANLDPCDATPPTVALTSGSGSMDAIKLTFSEALDVTGATNAANYTIAPSLAVLGATYRDKAVTLTTDKQTAGTTYTVAIKGLEDLSRNEIPAGTTATVRSYVMSRNGVLKFSYWGDANGGHFIPGAAVQALLDDPRYPANPDLVLPVYSFNSRDAFLTDTHENYGATIEGYVTPKETAQYRFFVYSDDASELWLSTDDQESNLAKVAEETVCCNVFAEPPNARTSEPISLTAGIRYFIRFIYKEQGGYDWGQVAWRKEDDTTPVSKLTPIPGEFLSSAVDLPVPPPAPGGSTTVQCTKAGNTLTISWSPMGGTLQSSPALGPAANWTDAGAANPATITIGAGNTYYRVRQ